MPNVTIAQPGPSQHVPVGSMLSVIGVAAVGRGEGCAVINSVTVAFDGQAPIRVKVPHPPQATVNFRVDVQVSDTPGRPTIYVTATDDGLNYAQKPVQITLVEGVELDRMAATGIA